MIKELLLKNLSVPKGVTDVVIDTDAQNEIDGQLTISYLLKSKKAQRSGAVFSSRLTHVKGITASF